MKPNHWHYWISILLGAALIPVLHSQHLPAKFDWLTLAIAYWLVLAAQSIFVAVLLGVIGLPRATWQPSLTRYQKHPSRIIAVFVFFAILAWATTIVKALILTVDAVALLELSQRLRGEALKHFISAIFAPAAYFFFGFLMVLAYNCVIVSARFNLAADPVLATIDRSLMHGHAVWDFTHWAVRTFPLSFFQVMEFIYFGMFPQIGATIILTALSEGRARALQFIGTILLAYYFALAIFYIWPAQGPYYLHPAGLPPSLRCYAVQTTLVSRALALRQHLPIIRISTDYFIEMPCMHIVQPLIVLWFLRPWRRMVRVLAAYDAVLVVAILVLEMHYVIDILVGLLVAAAAVAITAYPLRGQFTGSGAVQPGVTG
jgi:hypothetical protein